MQSYETSEKNQRCIINFKMFHFNKILQLALDKYLYTICSVFMHMLNRACAHTHVCKKINAYENVKICMCVYI
jgi:hypothetical protein